MKRTAATVALIVAAVGIGLAVLARRAPAPVMAGESTSRAVAPATRDDVSLAFPTASAATAAPTPAAPIAPAAISPNELQQRLALPRSGDPATMRQVGTDLRGCSGARLDSTRRTLDALARSAGGRRANGRPLTEEQVAQRREANEKMRRKVAECEALAPEERAQWFSWTERAATAGDLGARRDFFDYALDDFSDVDAVAANIDEIVRRRDLARQFLREAMAACAPAAFVMQPRVFDVLGTTDARERLALLHAAVLRPGSQEGAPARLLFEISSRDVDPAVIAEARQLGEAWIAHCPRDR